MHGDPDTLLRLARAASRSRQDVVTFGGGADRWQAQQHAERQLDAFLAAEARAAATGPADPRKDEACQSSPP